MTRILQVLGGTNRGGAETFVMNVFRNIDRDAYMFDILSRADKAGDYDDEIRALGGSVYYLAADRQKNKILRAWARYKKLMSIYKNGRYKIIHIHTNSVSCLPILLSAMLAGIKIRIVHSHSTNSLDRKIHLKLRFLLPCLATVQMACGKEAGRWLFGRAFLRRGNSKIINNAVEIRSYLFDDAARGEVRAALKVEHKTVLGHVGRFVEVKNHRFLIEIFCEFIKLQPESVLLLIGSGHLEEEIREFVGALNLGDRVRFLGVRDDINRLLMGMDCFVLPSFYEGLPIVTAETQASGLPAVVSDTVSDECKLTDCVIFQSLAQPASVWARTILDGIRGTAGRYEAGTRLLGGAFDTSSMVPSIEEVYRGAY